MDLGLGRWINIVLRQHGSAWCLSGPLKRLAFSRIISREAWETQNHQTFSSISLLGTLGPGDRRLCTYETCACVIHTNLQLHYYSTISDAPRSTFLLHLKRASETQNHLTFLTGYPSIRDSILHDIKLVLVSSHTAACCSSIVNLCLRGVHVLREALVHHDIIPECP